MVCFVCSIPTAKWCYIYYPSGSFADMAVRPMHARVIKAANLLRKRVTDIDNKYRSCHCIMREGIEVATRD